MKWLQKGFTENGGIIHSGCSVMRLDTKPEIIVDLEGLGGESSTVRSKNLIVSAQWEKLDLLLSETRILHRLTRRFNSIHPSGYPFSLYMGVQEGALPESMGPLTVLLKDGAESATDINRVILEMSQPGETGRAPLGRRALTATVFLKDSPLKLSDIELKGLAASIIDFLEVFLPFLRDGIDFINIEKVISLSRQYQEIANPKYRTSRGMFWGIGPTKADTPLSNVFLTGAILRPDLGFEGEVISGIDAVSRAANKFHAV